jgi:hypothetical protein
VQAEASRRPGVQEEGDELSSDDLNAAALRPSVELASRSATGGGVLAAPAVVRNTEQETGVHIACTTCALAAIGRRSGEPPRAVDTDSRSSCGAAAEGVFRCRRTGAAAQRHACFFLVLGHGLHGANGGCQYAMDADLVQEEGEGGSQRPGGSQIPTGGARYFKYRPPLGLLSRWIGIVRSRSGSF